MNTKKRSGRGNDGDDVDVDTGKLLIKCHQSGRIRHKHICQQVETGETYFSRDNSFFFLEKL